MNTAYCQRMKGLSQVLTVECSHQPKQWLKSNLREWLWPALHRQVREQCMGGFVHFMPGERHKVEIVFVQQHHPINFLPRGDEELLGSAIILIDGHHAWLENSQGGDVGREDTKGARE